MREAGEDVRAFAKFKARSLAELEARELALSGWTSVRQSHESSLFSALVMGKIPRATIQVNPVWKTQCKHNLRLMVSSGNRMAARARVPSQNWVLTWVQGAAWPLGSG